MKYSSFTLDEKREFCAHRVTLNGEPAQIVGAASEYATIRDVRTGLSAQWSWDSVAFVLHHRDGAFSSI